MELIKKHRQKLLLLLAFSIPFIIQFVLPSSLISSLDTRTWQSLVYVLFIGYSVLNLIKFKKSSTAFSSYLRVLLLLLLLGGAISMLLGFMPNNFIANTTILGIITFGYSMID